MSLLSRLARSAPLLLLAAGLLVSAFGGQSHAFEDEYLEEVAGPVAARVTKVRDGDTAEVEAYVWPGHIVAVAVRLRGVDAPEHRGKCDSEKAAADVSQTRLTELVEAAGGIVTLTAVSGDKYFGRVLADMQADGRDVARQLLAEGHVAPYDGKARRDWCEPSETAEAPRPSRSSGGNRIPGFPGLGGRG